MDAKYHLTNALDAEKDGSSENSSREDIGLLDDDATGFVRGLRHRSYPPAEESIDYEVKDFDLWFIEKSPYMGYPTDEIDARWHELYNFGITEISHADATKLANKTLRKPGTDKYLIELDVFHQLHCLNDLRKAFYPERYPGKWPYKDGKVNYKSITFMHWDHCIDALRQTLMCHGDISVVPFHINPINNNLVPELATRHTCRNFEKIQDWARERQADEFDRKAGVLEGIKV